MRNALLIGASALALAVAGSANGEDLHFKAPVAPAPLAFSWSGCYVGGHVGWGWGSTSFRDHSTSNVFSTGGGGPTGGLIDASDLQRSASVDKSGGLFGGQVGCDYQFNTFVLGVVGSISGAAISGSDQNPFSDDGPGGLISTKTDSLADISGRLGITWSQALLYAKGGVAWAHNK